MSVATDFHLALCQVTYVCWSVCLLPDNDGDEPAGVVSTSSDGHHRPALLLRRDAGHERQELDADAAGALWRRHAGVAAGHGWQGAGNPSRLVSSASVSVQFTLLSLDFAFCWFLASGQNKFSNRWRLYLSSGVLFNTNYANGMPIIIFSALLSSDLQSACSTARIRQYVSLYM